MSGVPLSAATLCWVVSPHLKKRRGLLLAVAGRHHTTQHCCRVLSHTACMHATVHLALAAVDMEIRYVCYSVVGVDVETRCRVSQTAVIVWQLGSCSSSCTGAHAPQRWQRYWRDQQRAGIGGTR